LSSTVAEKQQYLIVIYQVFMRFLEKKLGLGLHQNHFRRLVAHNIAYLFPYTQTIEYHHRTYGHVHTNSCLRRCGI